MGLTRGVVREWWDELGWGVITSPDVPDSIWAHYSTIDATGFRGLSPGDPVEFAYEEFTQDGHRFRVTMVRRVQ